MLLLEPTSGLLTILALSGEGSWSLLLCRVSSSSISNPITRVLKIRGNWWRTRCSSDDLVSDHLWACDSVIPTLYSPAPQMHLVLHMLFIHQRILEALFSMCSLKTFRVCGGGVCVFLERVNTGTSSLPPPEYIIEELGISLKCMQLFDSYPGNFMCVCVGGSFSSSFHSFSITLHLFSFFSFVYLAVKGDEKRE